MQSCRLESKISVSVVWSNFRRRNCQDS
ncbi:hypothetical protein OIU78_009953 [Salix suchowensis]|nr:hypothetical protein OIU78_009953 [Salix suchowensis]